MGARVACVFAYIVKIREVTYTQRNVIHVIFSCYIPYIWFFCKGLFFANFATTFTLQKLKYTNIFYVYFLVYY